MEAEANAAAAAASASELQAASKKRARPVEPPIDQVPQLSKAEIMQMVDGATHQEHDRVLVVEVSDKFCDTVLADGDARMIGMLHLVSGAYFDTNIEYGERNIWKSVQIPEGHNNHMLWFVYDRSWYCADDLFDNHKDRDCTTISMWSKLDEDAFVPRNAHFPYWSKKVCRAISVKSMWDYMVEHMDVLQGKTSVMCTEPEVDKLLNRILDLEAQLDAALPQGKSSSSSSHHESSASSSHQGGGKGDQGGGKGDEGDNKNRAGWMPKVATLVTAVYEKKWNYVNKLCDRMYKESPTLKKLVDTKMSWT